MNEQLIQRAGSWRNGARKTLAIAQWTMCLVLSFVLGGHATGFSQHRLTLPRAEISYRQLFEQIRVQTGCIVMYSNDVLDHERKVTVEYKATPLDEVFDAVLSPHGLTHERNGEFILIVHKPLPVTQAARVIVSGRVTDASGVPLPGVTIRVKGSTRGTATDSEGRFQLGMEKDEVATLVFSFIGMKTKEVPFTGAMTVDVVMELEISEMDEVVVTGYQRIERRKLTSAISQVDMERLKGIHQPNIDKLLQGQVPGMMIMSTSGAPGATPQIRIRGTSTISGNVQPLWVVDGIILDDPVNASVDDILNNRNLIASGIGGVNIDDIESINVLKDAAATAIYGTRAANGVIVITSKKGSAGKTRVSYAGSLTIGERPRLENAYMMNSKERIDVNMEMIRRGAFTATSAYAGQYGTVTDFERYFIDVQDRKLTWQEFEEKVKQLEEVNTDWFDHLFRDALSQRHSLNISGGNEKTTFYLSGSYTDEQATAKKVGMQTYTGAVKVYTRLRDNLRVGGMLDINARKNKSFFAQDSRENPYEWAIYTTRAHRAHDEEGNFNYMYINNLKFNFLENRDQTWRVANSFGMKGTIDLEWRITPALSYNTLFSFTRQNTTEEDVATEDSYFVRARKKDLTYIIDYTSVPYWADGGYRKFRSSNNSSLTFRNQLSYMQTIASDHRFDVMIGQEIRTSNHEAETTEIYGYAHDRGHQQVPQYKLFEYLGRPAWTQSINKTAALSWYGTAGYTFRNRYTVSLNGRIDGSNRFGIKTNDLFQPLWAVGANYQLKEEEFLKQEEWITYLTLRASYGTQGNVASQAYSSLVATIGTLDPEKNENYLVISAPKNPNLKWEKNYTVNAAVEFGLFKRGLSGIIEYYHKKGVDMLGSKQVSRVSGFSNIQVNWASILNRGWEFSLNSINIDTKAFRWTSLLTAGYNYNEVLDVYSQPTYSLLTNAQRTNYSASAVVGKPINGLWSYEFAGLNAQGRPMFYNGKMTTVTDAQGNTREERATVFTGMNNIDALVYSGSTMPSWQGGLTNAFYYKNFTLSALLVGSFGNVIRLRSLTTDYDFAFPAPGQNLSREFASRWRQPGDEQRTNIPVLETDPWESSLTYPYPASAQMYNNSDLRTVKGDYVRLQNLSLAYDLFSDKMRARGIQNIRFMVQGYNLHAWHTSRLKGQDPEATGAVMKYSATNSANVSFGNTYLPLTRSYTFSVNVQF
ncbi:MAG: SusC/RagA family TonB-linked outer membrane protein [Odoribacteraceae bacterium]|jgi:TonB-linked SusC/RagA family outer membrane protein|nr:SusC/RagA family TonB-linked outer membrane protein [Odoribacteraceae bacterium]